jgi:peptidyl-prolyl cis-trans isomerase B (cyclophilin B)
LTRSFAEILQREDHRRIGNDNFFQSNMEPSRSPETRRWTAIALGRIGNPKALPLLYKSLRSDNAALRAASAFAIGQIEDRRLLESCRLSPDLQAVAELRRALNDSSIAVRVRALEALGKVAPPDEATVILEILERQGTVKSPVDTVYLDTALAALARLGNPMAVPVLERLSGSQDAELRSRVMAALAYLNTAAFASRAIPGQPAIPAASLPEPCSLRDSERPAPGGGDVTESVAYALASYRKNTTIAQIQTSKGPIEIELFREDAPVSAERFALMARRGIYNATRFAQATQRQTVETEGPQNLVGFRRLIRTEINMRPFERGSVGLRLVSGGSDAGRFFIALAPQPYLNGIHTCFGRVISGIQVADRLLPGDRILTIRIMETISFHNYQPYWQY